MKVKLQLNELLPVIAQHYKGEERRLINARGLWQFLESKQEFANWIKARIEEYDFTENQDYFLITLSNKKSKKDGRGRKPIDYLITLLTDFETRRMKLIAMRNNRFGKLAA